MTTQRFLFLLLLSALVSFAPILSIGQTAPTVAIQLHENNKLYFGKNTPVSIVAQQDRAVSLDQLKVTGGTIAKTDIPGVFMVRPDTVGDLIIHVKVGKEEVQHRFYAKQIGPLLPLLGAQYPDGTSLTNGAFKAQGGMVAAVECCGFDAKCKVDSYFITRITLGGSAETAINTGARFDSTGRALIDKAMAGDTYIFSNISARCPGDTAARTLNTVLINLQ